MKTVVKPSKRNGFSLIELLVVIAVIAILSAIIFPVFSSVMEGNRRTTMISNYRIIQDKLAAYYLDHDQQYPDVLFGNKIGAADNMGNLIAEYKGTTPPPGLYPTYITDWHVFTDPDNQTTDPAATVNANVNTLTLGTLVPAAKTFFTMDAMDVSPQITGPNLLSKTVWVPRYQRAWTSNVGATGPFPGGVTADVYNRQLMFPTADGNTLITCSTYHVPRGKVVVLYKSGFARVMDVGQFAAFGTDVADISAAGAPPLSPARFWTGTSTNP
jgi:prepilin-type N-terminal cleavage/methylation domain-containing protein